MGVFNYKQIENMYTDFYDISSVFLIASYDERLHKSQHSLKVSQRSWTYLSFFRAGRGASVLSTAVLWVLSTAVLWVLM